LIGLKIAIFSIIDKIINFESNTFFSSLIDEKVCFACKRNYKLNSLGDKCFLTVENCD
jgi:hypothetical protein